jgi:hypothetical protein
MAPERILSDAEVDSCMKAGNAWRDQERSFYLDEGDWYLNQKNIKTVIFDCRVGRALSRARGRSITKPFARVRDTANSLR